MIQWSGIKKMEVTVVVVRSSIACVAVVSVFVSPKLSQAARKRGRWKKREGRSQKRDLTYLPRFFFSRFQKETRKTASQARSLIVGSLGN